MLICTVLEMKKLLKTVQTMDGDMVIITVVI